MSSTERFIAPATELAAAKSPQRNSSSGSIGCSRERSTPMKAAASAIATAAAPSTSGLSPPCPAWMNANVSSASAAPARTTPVTSSPPVLRSELSWTARAASAIATMTIGTFTKNTARQPTASVSAPPSRGPAGSAALPIPAQIPIARARSSPLGYASLITASVPGNMSAAPAPCATRNPTSAPAAGASPHPSDPAPNTARPARTMRLWP